MGDPVEYRSRAYAYRFCKSLTKGLPGSEIVVKQQRTDGTWYVAVSSEKSDTVDGWIPYIERLPEVESVIAKTIRTGSLSADSTYAACIVIKRYQDHLGMILEAFFLNAEHLLLGIIAIGLCMICHSLFYHSL